MFAGCIVVGACEVQKADAEETASEGPRRAGSPRDRERLVEERGGPEAGEECKLDERERRSDRRFGSRSGESGREEGLQVSQLGGEALKGGQASFLAGALS